MKRYNGWELYEDRDDGPLVKYKDVHQLLVQTFGVNPDKAHEIIREFKDPLEGFV